MAEFEELRIVVSLDNKAVAGLNDFKKQLAEFTSGQPAQHLENFKRHNTLLTQLLKATNLEATGTAKSLIDLGARFVGVAGPIGLVAYALYKSTSIVADAAKSITDQANKLKSFGVPYAEGRNIIDQYKLANIEANKTLEDIQAANELQFQARLAHGSEMFDQLRALLHNDPYVNEFKERLAGARTQAELQNVVLEGQQKVSELSEKYYHSEDKAIQARTNAENRARFRKIVGLNEEFDRAVRVREVTKDQAAAWESLAAKAKEFAVLWNTVGVNFGKIGDVLEGKGIEKLTPLLQGVKELTEAIFLATQQGMNALKQENFWKLILGKEFVDPFTEEGGKGALDPRFVKAVFDLLEPNIYEMMLRFANSGLFVEFA